MKIKTYTAPQLSEALAQIKSELGEEALILSTKEVPIRIESSAQPVMGYEVVAASDPDAEVPRQRPAVTASPTRKPEIPMQRVARTAYAGRPAERKPTQHNPPSGGETPGLQSAVTRAETTTAPATAQPSIDRTFYRELQELKRFVRWSAQSVPGARIKISDPDADALFVELVANDMDESLARRLIAEAQEGVGRAAGADALEGACRQILRRMITVSPIEENCTSRIVAAFIGPTGVGKTTTIAKLAARFALELGKKTALVTQDTYRIGASEQLKIYAELIGLPLYVASTRSELENVMDTTSDVDIVLMDTVGRAHCQLNQLSELAEFLGAHQEIEKHLVLSLTTKPLDLHEIINSFELFGTDKLLFTKLDETLTYGAAANELIRLQRPLSYLTHGQVVPQDIRIPTPESFSEMIIAKEPIEEMRQLYA